MSVVWLVVSDTHLSSVATAMTWGIAQNRKQLSSSTNDMYLHTAAIDRGYSSVCVCGLL